MLSFPRRTGWTEANWFFFAFVNHFVFEVRCTQCSFFPFSHFVFVTRKEKLLPQFIQYAFLSGFFLLHDLSDTVLVFDAIDSFVALIANTQIEEKERQFRIDTTSTLQTKAHSECKWKRYNYRKVMCVWARVYRVTVILNIMIFLCAVAAVGRYCVKRYRVWSIKNLRKHFS